MLGDLLRCGERQLIALSLNKSLKRVPLDKIRRRYQCSRGGSMSRCRRRARHSHDGLRCRNSLRLTAGKRGGNRRFGRCGSRRDHHRHLCTGRRSHIQQITVNHWYVFVDDKITYEPIRSRQYQARLLPIGLQGTYPSVKLLLGNVTTESVQTMLPGVS